MFKNSFPNYGKSAILTDMNILTSLKVTGIEPALPYENMNLMVMSPW